MSKMPEYGRDLGADTSERVATIQVGEYPTNGYFEWLENYKTLAGLPAYIFGRKLPHCCNGMVIYGAGPNGFEYTLDQAKAEHLQEMLNKAEDYKAIMVVAHSQTNLRAVLETLSKINAEPGVLRAKKLMAWSNDADLWMIRSDDKPWL